MTLTLEALPRAIGALPDSVLGRWVGIDKIGAEGYWKAAGFEELVAKYLLEYKELRDDYQSTGGQRQLGELHEKIDQVYARLIGHKTSFGPSVIPLDKFRIRVRWQSLTMPVQYWCAAAGLVMYGREKVLLAEGAKHAAETAQSRWLAWAHALKGGEKRPTGQFVINIATRRDYWLAFSRSWSDAGQHLPLYRTNSTGQQKNFAKTFTAPDPEQLHLLALQEGNRWMQINVYDNHQYIEKGVRSMPPWVKIGFKQEIIKALDKWVPGDNDWETRINWTKWKAPQ